MPQHEIVGRDLTSGQPTRLLWREDKILALEPIADAPKDTWIAPPLLDLQINGFAGVDFQQDNLTSKELLHAVEKLRAAGCTRFLLTLITDRWPAMLARLQHLRKLRSEHDQLRRAIAGWHIEGPFLSAEPGLCGAHDPKVMIDPKLEYIGELRQITGNDPVLLTLAPERLDAIAAISRAVSLGIKVSVGHTDAPRK